MYLKQWAGKLDSKPISSLFLTSCVTLVKAIHLSEPRLLCQGLSLVSSRRPGWRQRNQGKAGGRLDGKQQRSHRWLPRTLHASDFGPFSGLMFVICGPVTDLWITRPVIPKY